MPVIAADDNYSLPCCGHTMSIVKLRSDLLEKFPNRRFALLERNPLKKIFPLCPECFARLEV